MFWHSAYSPLYASAAPTSHTVVVGGVLASSLYVNVMPGAAAPVSQSVFVMKSVSVVAERPAPLTVSVPDVPASIDAGENDAGWPVIMILWVPTCLASSTRFAKLMQRKCESLGKLAPGRTIHFASVPSAVTLTSVVVRLGAAGGAPPPNGRVHAVASAGATQTRSDALRAEPVMVSVVLTAPLGTCSGAKEKVYPGTMRTSSTWTLTVPPAGRPATVAICRSATALVVTKCDSRRVQADGDRCAAGLMGIDAIVIRTAAASDRICTALRGAA